MNYIELLTQEEKVNLCGIMGGKRFQGIVQTQRTRISENTKRIQG